MVSVDLNPEILPALALSVRLEKVWKQTFYACPHTVETSLIRWHGCRSAGRRIRNSPFLLLLSALPALVSVSSLADDGMRVGLFAFSPLRGEMRRSGEREGEGERGEGERGHRSSPQLPLASSSLRGRVCVRAAGAVRGRQGHFLPAGFPSLRTPFS